MPNSELKAVQLLSSRKVLRNACTLYEGDKRLIVAYLVVTKTGTFDVEIYKLAPHPFAAIECKRVGVEEGAKKGPQTIEKAKQGAYVARALSSVQRIRTSSGALYGVLQAEGTELRHEPYGELVSDIINSESVSLLKDFVLTVGS